MPRRSDIRRAQPLRWSNGRSRGAAGLPWSSAETLDGFTTFVPPRNAEALEIGHLERAIFGEHLRCLLRIPKRCSSELLQQLFCVLHVLLFRGSNFRSLRTRRPRVSSLFRC